LIQVNLLEISNSIFGQEKLATMTAMMMEMPAMSQSSVTQLVYEKAKKQN